ncbi:conserved hypothetical protein [Ixodes scapularis]|uniref:Uncharacterized protein n=1 Tax=Ixodes scapularis TaxID=6945 RepID=B7PG08_IXOSC|nr:conserved hypothetical protein [Ixodes scapularis]|eukprot:XP_002434130.1 conserved hypothetical protein [Ixodes scapularis]
MRAKSFLLLLGCIVATSTLVCLYGDPKPALDGLVSETHRQLSNLKNLKVGPEQREPQELERYLSHLGLSPPSPAPSRSPTSGPGAVPAVVGTAMGPDQVARLAGFLEACQAHFPDHPVVVYALDLGTVDLLQATCPIPKGNGGIRPGWQELLRQAGAVLWLEPDYQLTAAPDPRRVVGRALREGLAAPWSPEPQPTSALTHLGMFEYLGAPREAFFFHRMVDPSVMLLFDSPQVRGRLMLPWVRCALVAECITPVGAQSTGCRFDKKPLYRYSGCHRYDMSALNVILGLLYSNNQQPYVFPDEDHFFKRLPDGTDLPPAPSLSEGNTTVRHPPSPLPAR